MATDRWQQVKDLLQQALELAPEQRAAFLAEAYAKDLTLRQEIESLMALHQQADSFLEKPPLEESLTVTRDGQGEAEADDARQIGPYRILQEIGHGGMGVVYEAEQEKPVRRRIALKLIKSGMDTKAGMG